MEPISDDMVARASGATGRGTCGRYTVTVRLPVLMYGEPVKRTYFFRRPGHTWEGDGFFDEDIPPSLKEVTLEDALSACGVSSEEELTPQLLAARQMGRRDEPADTYFEAGRAVDLLVIRPGTASDVAGAALARHARVLGWPDLQGKGGRSQEIMRGRARSAAIADALAGLPAALGYSPVPPVEGNRWNRLPGPQPGAEAARHRVRAGA